MAIQSTYTAVFQPSEYTDSRTAAWLEDQTEPMSLDHQSVLHGAKGGHMMKPSIHLDAAVLEVLRVYSQADREILTTGLIHREYPRPTYGALHKTLHRLTDAGLIEVSPDGSFLSANGQGRPRVWYRLTDAGRVAAQVQREAICDFFRLTEPA